LATRVGLYNLAQENILKKKSQKQEINDDKAAAHVIPLFDLQLSLSLGCSCHLCFFE